MPLRVDGGIPIPAKRVPFNSKSAPPDVFDDLERPKTLRVFRVQQATPAWCYAACTEMVINFIHGLGTVGQCDIASFVKSGLGMNVNCCPDGGGHERCKRSGCTVGDFNQIFDEWKVVFQRDDDRVSLSSLDIEFRNARPVLVRVEWNDTSAHALLITGVDGAEVHVIDPLQGRPYGGWVRHSYLIEGFKKGQWAETWLGLTKGEGE